MFYFHETVVNAKLYEITSVKKLFFKRDYSSESAQHTYISYFPLVIMSLRISKFSTSSQTSYPIRLFYWKSFLFISLELHNMTNQYLKIFGNVEPVCSHYQKKQTGNYHKTKCSTLLA